MSGTGISGVIESTLTAIIFSDFFGPPENAEVKIVTPGIYPPLVKFYIQKREKNGDRIKLICRSRIRNLDCPSDFTDDDFDEDGNISTQTVLSRIAALGDFGVAYQDISILSALPALEKGAVMGKNCLTLLENIAKALFCTFREYDGNLRLCPFEQVFTEIADAELISPIKTGFNKTISKIILTNKAESFSSGVGGISQTVKVETPFASEDLCSALMSRLGGAVYKPFEAMVKTIFIPSATAFVYLNGEQMYANDIKVYIKKSGLFAKISCKAVSEDEWNYDSEISRKLHEKIAIGERIGNMTIMSEGAISISGEEHKAIINCNEDDEPAIAGDVLNLEAIEEIKLNPETLLTESKDLVGALNELFSAAPEGGDGIRSIDDLYPFMKASVWDKFSILNDGVNNGCGFYYPGKATLSSFNLNGYVCTALNMQAPINGGLTIDGTLNVYGFNTGDESPAHIATVTAQTNVTLGVLASFALNFFFTPTAAYEYWGFGFSVSSQSQMSVNNKSGSYTHIAPSRPTPSQIFIHAGQAPSGAINYNPAGSYSNNIATVYQGYGGSLRQYNYNISDINMAIVAFNAK